MKLEELAGTSMQCLMGHGEEFNSLIIEIRAHRELQEGRVLFTQATKNRHQHGRWIGGVGAHCATVVVVV